jgi:hypothetical protein
MKPIAAVVRVGVLVILASPCVLAQAPDARITITDRQMIVTGASIELDFEPVVTGAPYAAEGTTTANVTLSDGTHTNTTTTGNVSRDGQGRERREQTIIGASVFAIAGQPMQRIVTIADPVGKFRYTLDPLSRTARRVPLSKTAFDARRVIVMRANPATDAMVAGIVPGAAARVAIEPLGTQSIDGEMASGRRTVSTLADGTEMTDEQWTSTDLKVTLMSKHHDPRTGDVLYKLTNIVRGEPDASLFTVPHDYTIVDDVIALPRTPGQ